MDNIDKIYYINMESRVDRRNNITSWLEKTNVPLEKIERIDAMSLPEKPHIGCELSHIKALETFIKSGHNNCIIFEDDFEPLNVNTFWDNFKRVFDDKVEYDVIMCSYNYKFLECESRPTDYLIKLKFTYTASGYLITKEFAPKVLECLKEAHALAIEEEEKTKVKTHLYMNDVYWCKLMPVSKWYTFNPRIGKQYANHSDIEGHFVDYGV